jgi:hypothetical protein
MSATTKSTLLMPDASKFAGLCYHLRIGVACCDVPVRPDKRTGDQRHVAHSTAYIEDAHSRPKSGFGEHVAHRACNQPSLPDESFVLG